MEEEKNLVEEENDWKGKKKNENKKIIGGVDILKNTKKKTNK